MKTTLFRVIVSVTDIDAATRFYKAVLRTDGVRVTSGRHYFHAGVIVAVLDPRADGDDYDASPNPEPLYFAVDDLEGVHAALVAAGGRLSTRDDASTGPMGQITTRPWGERSFYAEDPYGNRLCFVDSATVFTGTGSGD